MSLQECRTLEVSPVSVPRLLEPVKMVQGTTLNMGILIYCFIQRENSGLSSIMNESSAPLRIVCFGDSLTLGYLSPTQQLPFPESIPYGIYLQEWAGSRAQVLIRGVCGETTQDMRVRFHVDVLDPLPHIVIIVGGTNDLGWGITPPTIMENLRFFYEKAQAHGILPVAVTVPSLRDENRQSNESKEGLPMSAVSPAIKKAIAQRVTLNQAITDFGENNHFPVVDWFSKTCEPCTQTLATEYSNDGLHLTTQGYRKLAGLIWTKVLEEMLTKKSKF